LKIFELLSDKISFGNQLYKRFQVLEIKKIFKEIQINFAKNKGKKLNGYMIIAKNKSLGTNYGLGVFYWEPECNSNWNGYTLGAFDNSGKPTSAMSAFAN
jgi:arabinogalactan endo-1,4-beta-galactosidase